jgi:ATP-dependent helicase/nuclease subunit B
VSFNALLAQDVAVLTASRRLAHAIRLGYARHAQQQGSKVWRTPRVLPWDTWLRQSYLDARALQSAPAVSRVLTRAQSRVLWDEVVSESGLASQLLNPSNAARLAARSWRRLHDYLISLDQLRAYDTPEANALYAWCRAYLRRCEALNAIDEARLAHWAHDSGLVPSGKIALAGFDAMPPSMSRLVESWRQQGVVVDAPRRSDEADIAVVAAADADAELELAARWARDLAVSGVINIGVIVPDLQSRHSQVRRVFEDVLTPGARHTNVSDAPTPVVIAAPAPVSTYPLVDSALLILRLAAGEVGATDVGRLLRSPFLGGGMSEQGARALADVRLREEQRDRWDWFQLEIWAGVTSCSELEIRARELAKLLRALPSSATASEWAERFHALWVSVGWPGDRPLSSVEFQTLEKFQQVLAEFGALGAITGKMSLRRALGRLQDLASDTPFEPETGDAAILVIDASTSAGMQFEALRVVGLDADRWPPPTHPDAFIPLELQRRAGIPEASPASSLDLATQQFQRWKTCAPQVVFSWARRDGDVELSPSPLLRDLPTSVAENVTPISLRHLLFDARPDLESVRDDHAPPVPSQAARGGSRTIELQSRCPFRAQAEVRLRAQPMPRVSLGVEPVDRGALLHEILEEIWGGMRDSQRLQSIDDATLEARVRESAERHVRRRLVTDSPHRLRLASLEIESLTQLVVRLLRQERQRPPFSVQLAETSESFQIGGLAITLRPDRIDLLESGGELLIDYKLGDSHRPRDWFDLAPGRPRRPQLPLYGLARADRLRALAYVVLAPGAVEYRGWSDGTNVGPGVLPYPGNLRIDLGDPGDWEALMHHWRFTLTRLAERYVAGEAFVDPLPQECATCHLAALCRVHERALDTNGAAEEGDA